jgi:hypothetical protein
MASLGNRLNDPDHAAALLHGPINFEGMLRAFPWRSMPGIDPIPSQDLADLLATRDRGFGSRRQFDMY